MTQPRPSVVRCGSDEERALLAAGWNVLSYSWGARLRIYSADDLRPSRRAVDRLNSRFVCTELSQDFAAAVFAHLELTRGDFPMTVQNAPPVWSLRETETLWDDGIRIFGVIDDDHLVGLTIAKVDGTSAETELTSVLRASRGLGLGAAVKGFSLIAMSDAGVTTFGTGGAEANTASLAMNTSLGFRVTERWVSLDPPGEIFEP